MLKRVLVCLVALLLPLCAALQCSASAYDAHPKLVVILVIDQFREDYLERYRADFKGFGFNLFLDHGAYFPDCYFDYANLVTAPGHAAIGTGAYSDGNGIAANQWWDLARNTDRPVSSVEDPRYSIVGLPSGPEREGASPRNLLASTLGDQVRLETNGDARLFGVSLKDRSAILPAGHSANAAYWIDPQSGAFVTSTYYMNSLPEWANTFNLSGRVDQARTDADVAPTASFYDKVGPTDSAIQYELDFVRALIQGEKLGSGNVTDVLTISISSTDILGHQVGPDAPQQRQLVDQLDGNLDQFFHWLDHNVPGGMKNVWVALSADHGVAPVPSAAAQLGMPAAKIDVDALNIALNKIMNDRFSPGQQLSYMLPHQELPYLALNIPVFEHAGVNEPEGERAVQQAVPAAVSVVLNPATPQLDSGVKPSQTRLPPHPRVFRTFTRLQMASLAPGIPPTEFGQLIAHSYSRNGGWYVMVVPGAYQMQGSGDTGTTHFSPYSYDRHVPLAFYGSAFTPGTYRGRVQPVDLAATLAALLNVNQPSASVGNILTQAIRPEKSWRADRTVVWTKSRAKSRSKTQAPTSLPNIPAPALPPVVPAATPSPTANPATTPGTSQQSVPPQSVPPSTNQPNQQPQPPTQPQPSPQTSPQR